MAQESHNWTADVSTGASCQWHEQFQVFEEPKERGNRASITKSPGSIPGGALETMVKPQMKQSRGPVAYVVTFKAFFVISADLVLKEDLPRRPSFRVSGTAPRTSKYGV